MRRFIKIDPPNPTQEKYRSNPLMWQRDMYEWGKSLSGKLEQASALNDTPLETPFVLGDFTATTTLAGTSTGTNVSNFLCTLVEAFTNKRMITSKE